MSLQTSKHCPPLFSTRQVLQVFCEVRGTVLDISTSYSFVTVTDVGTPALPSIRTDCLLVDCSSAPARFTITIVSTTHNRTNKRANRIDFLLLGLLRTGEASQAAPLDFGFGFMCILFNLIILFSPADCYACHKGCGGVFKQAVYQSAVRCFF